MKRKLFIGFLVLLGLCGSIYAQVMKRGANEDWDFCKAHCQPNDTGECAMYTVGSDGGYGAFSCGAGVIVYDSEQENP